MRRPDSYINRWAPSVMRLGQIIHNLVKSTGNKIGKLHFYNGFITVERKAKCRAKRTRFNNGRIPDSLFSEALRKSFCYFKNPAVFGNILPHNKEGVILIKSLLQCQR